MILTHSPTVPQAHMGRGGDPTHWGGRCEAQPRPGLPLDPTHWGGGGRGAPMYTDKATLRVIGRLGGGRRQTRSKSSGKVANSEANLEAKLQAKPEAKLDAKAMQQQGKN